MKILTRHRTTGAVAALALAAAGVVAIGQPAAASPDSPLTVVIAPHGKADAPAGDIVVPSIHAAQRVVKNKGGSRDVRVLLDGGTYELDAPLRFDAKDGGANGHTVTWANAPGEKAVLSGGQTVTGWTLHDSDKNI